MDYIKIIANAFTAFGTAIVATNLMGLPDVSVILAIVNALATGILAALIEWRTQAAPPKYSAKMLLI